MKLLLLLLLQTVHTQTTDPLPRLIQERETLVRQYEAANSQRNAFLADKPSKRDLEEVVGSLKGIIRKDTEIVQAVKEEALRTTAGIVAERQQVQQQATVAQTDQSSTRERFYDLENQIRNLEERERVRTKKLAAAEAEARDATQARSSREMLAAGLALLSAGLLTYVVRQRNRKPARRGKR